MAARLNEQVADRLRQEADLLSEQQANAFRVRAYRRAADTLAGLQEDLAGFVESRGIEGLESLPGIGRSLAAAIAEMVRTGRWARLERLRGATEPEKLFSSVPGIGPKLAREIHDVLQVDTLEALEAAAHDGRWEGVRGVGRRRAAMLRAELGSILARTRPASRPVVREPDVTLLLDVDREYRATAAQDALPKIAPKRFNPEGKAWLPILHTEREVWEFTALFSNTARVHELGRTADWVVVYFHTDNRPEGQRMS